jgi:hypothetical protein
MIRFLFRFLGLVVLAAAFVFFVYDGTKSIASNQIVTYKFGDLWSNLHQASRDAVQPAIEQNVGTWLWDPVVLSVLGQPAWLVLLIVGAFLILLGRRKKPLIGYAR